MKRVFTILLWSLWLSTAPHVAAIAAPVEFARDVQPILVRYCTKCHGPDKQQSDLRLDTAAAVLRGGNSGPAVVAKKSQESLLIDALTKAENSSAMPPPEEGKKLTSAELAILKQWIDEGAIGPKNETLPATIKRSTHWSFQPLQRVTPPTPPATATIHNEIDRFVLARLSSTGLSASAEADRATLIRRVYLDLTGLPPSVEEVDAFLRDKSPDAYSRLVDRLLESPHYGERWGRHWLDIARYADSNGYTIDSARSIWKYRDWVIDALNRDMPFDQFGIEQLAGDMLPGATLEQKIATGFHRNTLRNEEGGTDQEQFRVDAVVDRLSTTGAAFMGLTLGCARCHDHKYDPISQREFYQLFAIFNGADEPTLSVPTEQEAAEEAPLREDIASLKKRLNDTESSSAPRQVEWEKKFLDEVDALDKAGTAPLVVRTAEPVRELLKKPANKRSAAEKKLVLEEFRRHDSELRTFYGMLAELEQRQKQLQSKITTTLVLQERATPRETFVHVRGDFLRHGAKVEPNVPSVLPAINKPAGQAITRLDFARWLFTPQHPLTARVTVNRVWQAYFGQGLVPTENDFGTQGDKPSHGELLDWLASWLIDNKWSMKALHRLIVTSATYRQSSHFRGDVQEKDPYNKLLARQARLRLDAEVIRDEALAASGLLARDLGGPGVYPPQPEGIYRFTQVAKYWKETRPNERFRRTLYTFFWRSSPYPFLMTFDAPDANNACTRRVRSNTPLQALTLANDRAFVEFAQGLAQRVLTLPLTNDTDRLKQAFRWCLVREPTAQELNRLSEYLLAQRNYFVDEAQAADVAPSKLPASIKPAEGAAWTSVARVLLNLDEFVTRE